MSRPAWRPVPSRPYKQRDPDVTKAMMAAVRNRENRAEVRLRKALWAHGFRYRLHHRGLVGRPDIVLTTHRAVIFVDGDFWHGRALAEGGDAQLRQVIRGSRFDWWRAKLAKNLARDTLVSETLRNEGWQVIRIWESELTADFERTVERVIRQIQPRRRTSDS